MLLGTRSAGVLGARWNSLEGAAVANLLRFRRTVFVGVVYFLFLFFFVSFGLDCAVCPSSGLLSVGCYILYLLIGGTIRGSTLILEISKFYPFDLPIIYLKPLD